MDQHTPITPADSATPTSPRRSRAARPGRQRRTMSCLAVGGLALATLVLGGCSSDDDEATPSPETTHEHPSGNPDDNPDDDPDDIAADTDSPSDPLDAANDSPIAGDPLPLEVCDSYAELSEAMIGDPSAAGPALETLTASLPQALEFAGKTVAEGITAAIEGDESAMSSPSFTPSYQQLGSAVFDGCPASARLDVSGVDYHFDGLPSSVPTGTVALRFTNNSEHAEPHELIIVARPGGDDTSVEDIATLSPDELMETYPMVGLVFVDTPDASATTLVDLEPGSYVAICTIPVGGAESGPAHAAHGMVADFEVV